MNDAAIGVPLLAAPPSAESSNGSGGTTLHPLATLMRRYVHAYTNCHDFAECRRVMSDDYVLYMGEHTLRGREDAYIPATAKQYRQFPGLGLTVHDIVLTHDRVAMSFSEHGRSVLSGRNAAWTAVGLYRWNERQLIECRVEQDYYARRVQSRSGEADPIASAAYDPWNVEPVDSDERTERTVRDWLASGGIQNAPIGCLDNESSGFVRRVLISRPEVSVLDLFTAGRRAAFHVVIRGIYSGGLDNFDGCRHQPVCLYVTGLATVSDGQVAIRGVTDRLAAGRRMLNGL